MEHGPAQLFEKIPHRTSELGGDYRTFAKGRGLEEELAVDPGADKPHGSEAEPKIVVEAQMASPVDAKLFFCFHRKHLSGTFLHLRPQWGGGLTVCSGSSGRQATANRRRARAVSVASGLERPTSVSATSCPSLSFLPSPSPPRLTDSSRPGLKMENPQGSESTLNASRSDTPDQPVFNEPLLPPAAPFLAPSDGSFTPRDSYHTNNSVTPSAPLLPEVGEKDLPDAGNLTTRNSKPLRKRPLIWVLAVVAVALIAVAVVVPVYFVVIKPKNNTVTGGNSNGPNDNGNNNNPNPTHQPPTNQTSGGNGTTITTQDGTQFIYLNNFGGICE